MESLTSAMPSMVDQIYIRVRCPDSTRIQTVPHIMPSWQWKQGRFGINYFTLPVNYPLSHLCQCFRCQFKTSCSIAKNFNIMFGDPCPGGTFKYLIVRYNCVQPQDCIWGNWSAWDACSASCGDGSQERRRQISQQSKYSGSRCVGNDTETRKCSALSCPAGILL